MRNIIFIACLLILCAVSGILLVVGQAEWAYVIICTAFWAYFCLVEWYEDGDRK